MAHDHPHSRGPIRDCLAEYLLTMFVVGVLGLIGIMMYRNGQLGYILALRFHSAVLIGSVALLVIVVIRAISVWCEAGQIQDHHNDGALHDSERGTEQRGHTLDISWAYSRMLVLSFPVGLFLIGVPNSGFSQDRIRTLLGGEDALTGNFGAVAHRNGTVTSFKELVGAANDERSRELLAGRSAILKGRIRWINVRQFSLFQLKMTCCAADVVPLKVRIVLKNGTLSAFDDFDWIQMKGRLQFVQAPNSERYIPVIVVEDIRDIRKTEPKKEYD